MTITIERIEAKSLIRTEGMGNGIHLNPYGGCSHDCSYCDGKAEKYGMHEDFGTRIRAKMNAPAMLEAYLRKEGFVPFNRKRTGTLLDFGGGGRGGDGGDGGVANSSRSKRKFTINISGGVCDIYQEAERELGLTRRLLETVRDFGFPVSFVTKGTLVTRDIDLLKEINSMPGAGARVSMSIALWDERDRKVFEPGAPPALERFAALKALGEAGIRTGIWFVPILPWIGDTDENMDAIVSRAAWAGARGMCAGGMTLKPGRQKEEFMDAVLVNHPDLLEGYRLLYSNDDRWGRPDTGQAVRSGLADPARKARTYMDRYGVKEMDWDGEAR